MSPAESYDLSSIGVVLSSNGEVFLKSESGMRQVETGSSVYRGEELITGAGSNAEIRFADDTLLSQGSDSSISLDNYVYDDSVDSTPELLFNMTQGTFRMVTGKIAEQNPERFKIGSPLATIGIRGTITIHEIGPDGEKHGVEEIHSGKALLIQSIDGEFRQISSPRALVEIASSGLMSTVRPMTVQEFEQFQSIAPAAIQAEKEIVEQQEQEQQEQQSEGGEGEQQGEEDGEGEGEGEQQGEGEQVGQQVAEVLGSVSNELGGLYMAGESVLSLGADSALAGAFGVEAITPIGVDAELFSVAQGALDALSEGNFEAATELLEELSETAVVVEAPEPVVVVEESDIIELIEDDPPDDPPDVPSDDPPEDPPDDGITYELGDSDGNDWTGGPRTDYYKGLEGNDTINGNNGTDYLYGGPGDDTIHGDNSGDYLYGDSGNDTLYGDNGTDTMYGGTGNDVFLGEHGGDSILGGDGIDTISYAEASAAITVSLVDGLASGSDGEDVFDSIENIIGSSNNDTLVGDENSNTLTGGHGSDTLTGGTGADFFNYSTLCEAGDTITDFMSGTDKFMFLNTDNDGDFAVDPEFDSIHEAYNGTNAALGGDAGFVYDDSLNQFWYDSNGTGDGGNTLIATLSIGADVVHDDIDTGAIV